MLARIDELRECLFPTVPPLSTSDVHIRIYLYIYISIYIGGGERTEEEQKNQKRKDTEREEKRKDRHKIERGHRPPATSANSTTEQIWLPIKMYLSFSHDNMKKK